VVADPQQIQPGRGAYVHRSAECVDLAAKRRALARALRVGGLDAAALESAVASALAPAS
jgi:uncharacterized protein